ncbi:helix-turn-helix transcriptional regulator [Lentisalinibacter orientalis]|uniref:helix-turn-helix transcriptional regulator n=1 Tax=Lentisalinibacter orientalis TaxID=2992241 RepID=UPI00386E4FC3
MRILRKPEVLKRTGHSHSALYEAIAEGRFPKPVKLGPRASGWVESEVDAYIESLIQQRDSSGQQSQAA